MKWLAATCDPIKSKARSQGLYNCMVQGEGKVDCVHFSLHTMPFLMVNLIGASTVCADNGSLALASNYLADALERSKVRRERERERNNVTR